MTVSFRTFIAVLFSVKNKIKKTKFNPLLSGGALILGQEQDGSGSAGGFFDIQQGWSGKLTQVEIWDTVLPMEDIVKMAKCEIPSTMMSNQVVSWLSNKWKNNNVEIRLFYIFLIDLEVLKIFFG